MTSPLKKKRVGRTVSYLLGSAIPFQAIGTSSDTALPFVATEHGAVETLRLLDDDMKIVLTDGGDFDLNESDRWSATPLSRNYAVENGLDSLFSPKHLVK